MIGDTYFHVVTDCTQQSRLKTQLECLFKGRQFVIKYFTMHIEIVRILETRNKECFTIDRKYLQDTRVVTN